MADDNASSSSKKDKESKKRKSSEDEAEGSKRKSKDKKNKDKEKEKHKGKDKSDAKPKEGGANKDKASSEDKGKDGQQKKKPKPHPMFYGTKEDKYLLRHRDLLLREASIKRVVKAILERDEMLAHVRLSKIAMRAMHTLVMAYVQHRLHAALQCMVEAHPSRATLSVNYVKSSYVVGEIYMGRAPTLPKEHLPLPEKKGKDKKQMWVCEHDGCGEQNGLRTQKCKKCGTDRPKEFRVVIIKDKVEKDDESKGDSSVSSSSKKKDKEEKRSKSKSGKSKKDAAAASA